jgi:hypothetical protein
VVNIWHQAVANMANARDMPTSLRIVTALGLLGGVTWSVVVTAVSVAWGIGNRTTPLTNMWRTGAWATPFLWMLLIFVGCLGVAARRPGFRWILVVSSFVIEARSIPHVGLELFDVASAAFWGLISYAYLFLAPSVRRYFAVATP